MKLDKNSRKLLNMIIKSKPTIQDKAYDIYVIAPQIDVNEQQFWEILRHLEKEGAIELDSRSGNILFLTERGRYYQQFQWQDIRDFLFKSVVVPIAVSFITTVLLLWLGVS